jgi:hypothetical protein
MMVSETICNEQLAELCAVLGASLLQYLHQAGAWTDAAHAEAAEILDRLATSQQQSFLETAELLAQRHGLPASLAYRSEFASLHYLALDYLIGRLIADQIGVVAATDDALQACRDETATHVLERIRQREAEHLTELRRLSEQLYAPREG